MKNAIPKKYWSGEGRKIIAIPRQVLKRQRLNNALLNSLHITGMGYYPHASKHHTHRKKGCPENILIYCTAGSGWVHTAAGLFTVRPHTFFVLPCNQEHEYGAADQDPWSIYWIMYGGAGLECLNDLTIAKQCFEPTHFPFETNAIQLFNEMFTVLEHGYSRQYLVYVNMLLANFLTLFLFQQNPVARNDAGNPQNSIIQTAINYMQLKLRYAVSIEELSRATGCSPSKLSHLFKKSTGYSPLNYFNHLRIQKACQHFYATNAKVKEVAEEMGYSDPYYFSRLFTRLMGVSPRQYRDRNSQNWLQSK